MKIKIDLFSDTNTNPSIDMRNFMAKAEVGNEAAGEDPTVNELIEEVCTLLGKEAGIFLPTGTMCNGIAYRVFCNRQGDHIILDRTAHPLSMASGLIGGLVNAVPCILEGTDGIFSEEQFSNIIRRNDGRNLGRFRVVSIEQTTNLGGGRIWPLDRLHNICSLARGRGIYCHMDGARLLNAVIATQIPAYEYAAPFDSVWIDFSKGLGAPMGAVLVGSKEFIEEAWYYKFQQGGALHQAGMMAAGCIYALRHNTERLQEDHHHAKLLASLLATIPSINLDLNKIDTNIICFEVVHRAYTAQMLVEELLRKGIRGLAIDIAKVRFIIHKDIREEHVYETYEETKNALAFNVV